MATRRTSAKAAAAVVVKQPLPRFNLANTLGVAIIGLLVSLIGSGVVGMIALYVNQARLTEQVTRTSSDLAKHLEHSVDRDDYLRRDSEITHLIEKMATKEELRDVRRTLEGQNQLLRDMQATLTSPRSRR